MEIVYYWVENQQNIINQGFNFSPEIKCQMTKTDGKYNLEIRKTGKINIMTNEVVSNVTVLVGENGSGKTSLMRSLDSIHCSGERKATSREYDDFEKERNENNRCLYLVRQEDANSGYHIVTNIKKENLEIVNTDIELENSAYYSDDTIRLQQDLSEGNGINGITSVYLTNASYSYHSDSLGTYRGIQDISFMPGGLLPVKDAFFDFIYPEQSQFEKLTEFEEYSRWLKNKKTVGEFQQFCDLLYCNEVWNKKGVEKNTILEKMELDINVRNSISIYEELLESKRKTENDVYDKIVSIYDDEKAKCSVIYIFKANLILEYMLAIHDTEIQHNDELTTIESVFEYISDKIDKTRKYDYLTQYFVNAILELRRLEDILSNGHLHINTLPIPDLGFKTGSLLDNQKFGKQFMNFIVDCMEYNHTLTTGIYENKYGSFCLRYLTVTNLGVSSGERALQNMMSWLYWISKMGDITSSSRVVPKENILVCIDEIDALCHPAWQRDIIGDVINELEQNFKGYHIQLLISTHSPLCLSNVPVENTIYLVNDESGIHEDKSKHEQTFGRNLYDILNDSFYLKGVTMGKYALCYINELIDDINRIERGQMDVIDKRNYPERIDYIGDPLIREKLYQLLAQRLKPNSEKEARLENLKRKKAAIEDEIRRLEKQDV